MSRSGYSNDLDILQLGRWRGVISSASKGKRGQAFFRALIEALDAMPVKELAGGEMVDDSGCMCALAALDKHRGGDPENLDPYDHESLGREFDIAHQLAQEVMYENDDGHIRGRETPGERWTRMRAWAAKQVSNNTSAEVHRD